MKNINLPSLILAMLVVASFLASAVAIGYRNYWLTGLSMLIGFLIMFIGIRKKTKNAG